MEIGSLLSKPLPALEPDLPPLAKRLKWVHSAPITVSSFPSAGEVLNRALQWRASTGRSSREQNLGNHHQRSKMVLDYLRHHHTNYDRLKEQLVGDQGAEPEGQECIDLAQRVNEAIFEAAARRRGFERYLNNDGVVRRFSLPVVSTPSDPW